MDKKKILIIGGIVAVLIIAIIIGFTAGKNNIADKNDETSKVAQNVIEFDNGETSYIDSDINIDYTDESTADLNETVDFNNETAETQKGQTTVNLHVTKDSTDKKDNNSEEATTSQMADKNNSGVNKEDATTTNKKEETTTENITTVPTTVAPTTTQEIKLPEQPTTTKPQPTTAPKPAVASGWKDEMVTEYFSKYVKKYVNSESQVPADLKARYDAICDKYLGASWGCAEMIAELEAQWEYCYCGGCQLRGVYDELFRYYFGSDGTEYYGSEIVIVNGYGSEAVDAIRQADSKAFASYAYMKIYYDSETNTSTAYICARGNII